MNSRSDKYSPGLPLIGQHIPAKELAKALGVPTRRVIGWALAGELPYVLMGHGRGRRYLFSVADLNAWIESRRKWEAATAKKLP